jgi:hypothetical protein
MVFVCTYILVLSRCWYREPDRSRSRNPLKTEAIRNECNPNRGFPRRKLYSQLPLATMRMLRPRVRWRRGDNVLEQGLMARPRKFRRRR